MSCLPNQWDTLGFDCSQSTRRGRIGGDGQLLHLLYDRYEGGGMCVTSRNIP